MLKDSESKDTDVLSDNAAADALPLPLAGSSRTVALLALRHEQTNAAVLQNALTHAEAILVIASRDLEDVSNELLSQDLSWELVPHPLIEECSTIPSSSPYY